ncbi:MAG TPA: IS66 family transposase [Candidatus Ozemobacteraceae bacterium]|nr:IS66 family transposase [Candidatus Ozemobacteraceae bacterium]
MNTPKITDEALAKLLHENEMLRKERDELQASRNNLEEQVRLLRSILYGKSSEKKIVDGPTPEQPFLPFDEADTSTAVPGITEATCIVTAHARQKPGRKSLPANLPRVDVEFDLPEDQKFASCGCPLTRIGAEITERLDIVPAKIQVLRYIRHKYAPNCSCEIPENAPGEVRIASLPPQIIPQGIVTPGLLAHVMTSKYIDAIPLYRQEQQFMRLGLDINRGTLASWVRLTAEACQPIFELLQKEVRAGPVIYMDETRVQVMKEPGRANTTQSYMWVCRGGLPDRPAVTFRYYPTRSGSVAEELLAGYRGYLHTDGYAGYEAVGERDGIRHLACWAHVRRKFVEVVKGTKGQHKAGVAQRVIDLIGKLYAIEDQAREQGLISDDWVAKRTSEARPVLDTMKQLLDEQRGKAPPKSLLGKAIAYASNLWPRLIVYLENAFLRLDNNLAENAIRPFAVGRKNWLFSGSPRGADASATLYSIIETAKANNIEPYAYLRLLFNEISSARTEADLHSLLPQYLDRSRLAMS